MPVSTAVSRRAFMKFLTVIWRKMNASTMLPKAPTAPASVVVNLPV